MRKFFLVIVINLSLFSFLKGQWEQVDLSEYSGINIKSIFYIDNTLILHHVTMNNTGFIYSDDWGTNWSQTQGTLDYYSEEVVLNGNNLFAGTGESGIYKSENFGIDWNSASNGLAEGFTTSNLVNCNSVLFACGDGIFKSVDAGSNWTNISMDNSGQAFSITAKGDTLFASFMTKVTETSYEEGVFKSFDGGNNWERITEETGLTDQCIGMMIIYDNVVLAAGEAQMSSGNIFVSKDFGNSWTPASGLDDIGYNNLNGLTVHNDIIYCATSNGIYYSDNYGYNWHNIGVPESSCVKVVGDTIYVGTYIKGLWKQAISDIVLDVKGNAKIEQIELYPNPSSDEINIYVNKNILIENETILIYNMQGQLVYKQKLKEGNNKVNISEFSNGIYIFNLKQNNEIRKAKIIKV